MSDVCEKIITANAHRHGRATVFAAMNGTYYANGYSGLGINAPMSISDLETNLTDRFASTDGTDDALTTFDTRSQTATTGITPITGVVEGTKLQIKAGDSNTGTIYIGKFNVTAGTNADTDGFPLAAGQGTYLPIVQTGIIHIRGTVPNDKIFLIEV